MTDSTSALFEAHRPHLLALAYRMLGSRAEAEDVVQDTWLRQKDVNLGEIEFVRAYLSRIATNLCLDRMQTARARREQYVGSWLPEPLEDATGAFDPGPQAHIEYAQNVSVAFMLALERLSALERAAFLLHDVFDQSFDEVALRLGRSAAACRQLANRARAHVRTDQARVDVQHEQAEQLLGAFVQTITTGDTTALAQLLSDDAVMLSDGGGIVTAVAQPLQGGALIAKALVGFTRTHKAENYGLRFTRINGLPAVVLYGAQGQVLQTTALQTDADGRISALYIMRNPEKLTHIR
ncbi:MAG: RNA polymerase sigma factor SigJ [Burkholderiaceae bacterium]|nr:RNA polymerase sigma factor SigJ [Burkholderiaceae bacterium]